MKNLKPLLLIFCMSFLTVFSQENNTTKKTNPKSDFKGVNETNKNITSEREELILDPRLISSSFRWTGDNTTSGKIYRTGITGIGLTNPPSDTRLYVKSNNLKVGIVSEVSHIQDYQYGILSAVDRANTKALSVLLKENGNYTDKFVVMGNGNVKATEVRVKINIFPDYVFKDDYDLTPLYKVEKFIKKHKHLPNIPKGSVLVKEGLKLGEMQVKQMEKIEELFLYVIKLEKKVDSLKKELKEVKNLKN